MSLVTVLAANKKLSGMVKSLERAPRVRHVFQNTDRRLNPLTSLNVSHRTGGEMSGRIFRHTIGGHVAHTCSVFSGDPARHLRPKCDRYGCLIPLVPQSSGLRSRPITKLGYDSCQMPMILRQRCPSCTYREVPDMCCKRVSKFPNPCLYEEMDMHHKRLYGEHIYRFEGACRF